MRQKYQTVFGKLDSSQKIFMRHKMIEMIMRYPHLNDKHRLNALHELGGIA